MPLIAYVPDPQRYDGVFTVQVGHGTLTRYRGSYLQNGSGFFPQILKNLFAKIANIARPIIRSAAPHAKAAFEAAKPHLQEAATEAIKDTRKRVTDAISRRFDNQEGQGIRKKRARKSTRKVTRIRRIPPRDIPDYF